MSNPRHQIHVGIDSFFQGGPRTQKEWEDKTNELLNGGHPYLAYDLAQKGRRQFADSMELDRIAGLALLRTGAVTDALKIVERYFPRVRLSREAHEQALKLLQKLTTVSTAALPATPQLVEEVEDFGRQFQSFSSVLKPDLLMLGLVGHVYKKLWRRSGDLEMARLARTAYLIAYRMDGRSTWVGINAATLSWLSGEKCEEVMTLAGAVLDACQNMLRGQLPVEERYWPEVTVGEAYLVRALAGSEQRRGERLRKAKDAYRSAHGHENGDYGNVVSSAQQLDLIRWAVENTVERSVLKEIDEMKAALRLPQIVVFTGHRIDGAKSPRRFPNDEKVVAAVKKEIDLELDRFGDALIGYSSAASGSDLLFIEAMKERGHEVNVVLPFEAEDFREVSVGYADEGKGDNLRWGIRYDNALKMCQLRTLTEEQTMRGPHAWIGDDDRGLLFRYANDVMGGVATLRAKACLGKPALLAVVDEASASRVGGAKEFRDERWPKGFPKSIIALNEIVGGGMTAVSAEDQIDRDDRDDRDEEKIRRDIHCIMFTDVRGYSELKSGEIPYFMRTLSEELAAMLGRYGCQLSREETSLLNTWGDAVFAVLKSPVEIMHYAFALQHAMWNIATADNGLPGDLSMRIALHAGPAYLTEDPVTGSRNVYGDHVNRAARLEPVTEQGAIFVSEPFAAYLELEMERLRSVGTTVMEYELAYLGELDLAKDFGDQVAYRITNPMHERALEKRDSRV